MDDRTLSLLVIIVLLTGIIFVQNIIHKQERKDLYNRIMARDLHEYSGAKPGTVKNILRKNYSRQNTPK
jgi:hypothetical protein